MSSNAAGGATSGEALDSERLSKKIDTVARRGIGHAVAADLNAQIESGAQAVMLVDCHVWVGGQERPAFLWQARVLAEEWDCPWTVDPGRHHFDVIDGLEDGESPLMRACLDGLG